MPVHLRPASTDRQPYVARGVDRGGADAGERDPVRMTVSQPPGAVTAAIPGNLPAPDGVRRCAGGGWPDMFGGGSAGGLVTRSRPNAAIFDSAAAGAAATATFPATVPVVRPISRAEALATAFAARDIWVRAGVSSAASVASTMPATPRPALRIVVAAFVVSAARTPATVPFPTSQSPSPTPPTKSVTGLG